MMMKVRLMLYRIHVFIDYAIPPQVAPYASVLSETES